MNHQRLHGAHNNHNLDTINCESYAIRLNKNNVPINIPKEKRMMRPRDNSQTRTRPGIQQVGKIVPTVTLPSTMSINPKSIMPRQSTISNDGDDLPISNIIRKEIYDAACVEVTVKTHGLPNNGNRQKPRQKITDSWGKILKEPQVKAKGSLDNVESQTSQTSQFKDFDPLRTVHFLAKELQTKVTDVCPNDAAIQQMVMDMQLALNRVPPEVASMYILQQGSVTSKKSNSSIKAGNSKKESKTNYNYRDIMEPEKLVTATPVQQLPIKPINSDKSVQTIKGINYVETEKLQKHLEESTEKIEVFCKQMEQVCTRLKNEKEEVEELLKCEREKNAGLKKQIEELEQIKVEQADALTKSAIERDDLNLELSKLKSQIDTEMGPKSEQLKETVDKLRTQKTECERQAIELKHQLTVMTMSKEKYVTILAARDKQISEMQAELCRLQDWVKDQLIDLQTNPQLSSNPASSTSIVTDKTFSSALLQRKALNEINFQQRAEHGDIVPRNQDSSGILDDLYLSKESSSYKELPSGDTSKTDSTKNYKKQMKSNSKIYSDSLEMAPLSRTQMNMRLMFEQIKNRALELNLPSQTSLTDSTGHFVDSTPSDLA